MLANIFSALEQLGLSAQKRALHVQFSNPALNSDVFLQRIDGQHALNQGSTAELICLSTDASIPLKQFIGSQVAIDQVTDKGTLFRTTGIITAAAQGQSDGSLTLYKLTLSDPTALWHKRRNSRVFMNKSAVDVVETLFQEWQKKSPLFASSLSLDLSGLKNQYDIRPFIMQSNESDYDFLTRLMRSEGINWLIDEAQAYVSNSSHPIEAQKLRLIDDNSQYAPLERRNIRFHRSSATEQQDSITSFIGQRTLQPTAVHVQRWQADVLEQEEGAGTVQSKHQHSNNQDNASLGLEQAWHFSPAWIQDLKGEDQATASNNSQIEKLNQNLSHYFDAQSKQFTANSTVRDSQVGYWFELNEHPEIDQHSGSDKEFLITGKHYYNQNNLPKDLNEQINQLLQQSQWTIPNNQNNEERQNNTLILQRRNITTVPEYNPLEHRPAAHPQRAKVVGPAGEEIHVDEWGRIKVRFLFTRAEDNQADGGAGSNNNDADSAWVDVLTPWAGEGYGARFLPRINEIVVIDFFDGNIDRPFVVGRIHEAQRSPTQFDTKGQLPDTKKLAGIRSKEVQGEGFGQLRFDDTTGQISTQLQNSHGATQLNLGNLSHPKETSESEGRGEGFELRTDQWGGIRAGQGLLLSTHKQDQATGTHLDAKEAKSQLEGSLNNSKALSEVAKNQQTDPLEVLDRLKDFLDQIEKGEKDKADAFKQALMILASPNSIALASNEDIHISADGQISHSAGDSINISTQKSLIGHASKKISLFAAQEGARLYAAKGKIEIQAQGDALDVIARRAVQVISTEDVIEFKSPKEIILTAGGSQLKINGSGIFSTTGGKFEVKAGQHQFIGGAKVNNSINLLPQINSNETIVKKILLDVGTNKVLPYRKVRITTVNDETILTESDANGYVPNHVGNYKFLEVLPEENITYLSESFNKQQVLHKLNKVENIFSDSVYPVPADQVTKNKYIQSVTNKNPTFAQRIQTEKANGFQLDAVPDVPQGAVLEKIDILVNRIHASSSKLDALMWFQNTASNAYTMESKKLIIDKGYFPKKYFYVFTHGGFDGKGDGMLEQNFNPLAPKYITDAKILLREMKKKGFKKQPVMLLACQQGNRTTSMGEKLSKLPGVGTVYGPTSLTWWATTADKPFKGIYPRFLKARESKMVKELAGALRVFNLAKIGEGDAPKNPPSPAPNRGDKSLYTVKDGDTLSRIASNYSTTWQKICDINGIPYGKANNLKVGQKLKLPKS